MIVIIACILNECQDRDAFLKSLPNLELTKGYKEDGYICWNIKQILNKGTKFSAMCPLTGSWQNKVDLYSHPVSFQFHLYYFIQYPFGCACHLGRQHGEAKTSS